MDERLLGHEVLKHLDRFMLKAELYPLMGGRTAIAVSAGVDSMCLGYLLNLLFVKKGYRKPVWIHINHGTREECAFEERFIKEQCANLDIELHLKTLNLALGSNFESNARKHRYEAFELLIKDQKLERIYLGHNIDDSFEWNLMQQFKSSKWPNSLGIPVIRGAYARPFHCLSKKQIYYIASVLKIPYLEDTSNQLMSFERNFLRHKISSVIKEKYPACLKHYVSRANQEARERKVCVFKQDEKPSLIKDALGGVALTQVKGSGHFRGHEQFIYKAIHLLSSGGRGKLREQVGKIIEAQKGGKRGPLILTKGIRVYLLPGIIHFVSSDTFRLYQLWDKSVGALIAKEKASQIPCPNNQEDNMKTKVAPFWILIPIKHSALFNGENKKAHELFPCIFSAAKEKGLILRPMTQVLNICHKKGIRPDSLGLKILHCNLAN